MKKSKKIIAAALIAALLPNVIYAQSRFTDMDDYEWAQESVDALYERGVIKGTSDTEYSPAAEMKRGDFALMLARYFELSGADGENYSDVNGDTYYADAILNLKAAGAYDGDLFEPERTVTREEAMSLIYNTLYNTVGVSEEQFSDNAAQYYSDAQDIKWDKINAVATLTNIGIVQGDEGRFMPQKTMTRAELAVMFFNLEEKDLKGSKAEIPSNSDLAAMINVTADTSDNGKQYSASGINQSVVLVENASYTASGVTLSKVSGGSLSPESSYLKGLNSALAAENAQVMLSNTSVLSSADNSDAVFALDNSEIMVLDSALVTTGYASSAAAISYDGRITMQNTRLSTAGDESPVIKVLTSGTASCDGLYVMSAGKNSAGIYSAGKITVNKSTVSIPDFYSVQIDGKGEVLSSGSTYSGQGIMLYQSGKEGTQPGMGRFSASDSKISSSSDTVFYVTNTDAEINLINTEITAAKGSALLKAAADIWGNEDANGGHVSLNTQDQILAGNIVTDGISSVTLNLTGKSEYSGALNTANYTGAMNIFISSGSVWNVTADSYVTAVQNESADCSNINSNGHNIYYDPAAAANAWLDGGTIQLSGGGELKPVY